MKPELTVIFDNKGTTTIVQDGVEIKMSIHQRLVFTRLFNGSIPPKYMVDADIDILPNGQVIEGWV